MKKQLPNILTYSRILVIPIIVAAFWWDGKPAYYVPSALFLYASITDFFDGYLARIWNAQSSLGRFLDPIADKLLVATCLMMLVDAQMVTAQGMLMSRAPILPAILILCREILVSGLREFLAELNVKMPVSQLAKYKTAIQMVAIFLLLLGAGAPAWLPAETFGWWGLWLAALLTLVTGYAYMREAVRHLRAED